jgi:hypothetical protein
LGLAFVRESYRDEFVGGRFGRDGRVVVVLPIPKYKAKLPTTAIRKISATITIRIAIFTVLRIIKKAIAATAAKSRKNTTAIEIPIGEETVSESATSNRNIKLILYFPHLTERETNAGFLRSFKIQQDFI